MDNLLELLRLQNIFGASSPIGSQPLDERPDMSMTSYEQPQDNYADLYKPEHMMQDRMTAMIDQFPERQPPGIAQKIFGSLAGGAGGPDAADRFMYGPYRNQVLDWKSKFEPVLQGANQERYQNTNMRQLANSMITQDRMERNLQRMYGKDAVSERQGDARIGQGEQKIAQGDKRLELRTEDVHHDNALGDKRFELEQARQNGGSFHHDDQGNAFIITRDGRKVPIEAEYLTADEKAAMDADKAERVTKAREGAKRDRVVTKVVPDGQGGWTYTTINQDAGTATAPVDTTTKKPISAPRPQLDMMRETSNKARAVLAAHPEWQKYINILPNGQFNGLTKPSSWMYGHPDEATYNQVYQSIYGEAPKNESVPGNNGTNKPLEKPIPGHPGKTAISTDGGKTWKVK